MKALVGLALVVAAQTAWAKNLVIPDNAWRPSALTEMAPYLRYCIPRADVTDLPRLPRATGPDSDIQTSVVLQEPGSIGKGHWYRIGWRAKDGTVYIVAARSPDGQKTVFGPVSGTWTCLPAELRKELNK
jgi:hypothetical protein